MSDSSHSHAPADPHGKALLRLTIGALGVVYGDIGTSPLYALKESFHPSHGIVLTPDNVFGVLSLVFWSLTLIVTLKYLVFILRADNHGEGGIMALLALLIPKIKPADGQKVSRAKLSLIFLGLFGASLLYGDGVITPAISVLSAVEGLQLAAPALKPLVVPITVVILVALFLTQSRGTARLGSVFGRLTAIWFLSLIATGLPWIFRHPEVLQAINPYWAAKYFAQNGWSAFFSLGGVVLCITGGEALYADMGHFGRRPIRVGWYGLVFPALLINYFGQGALVLERGAEVIDNTFYALVSGPWIYPLVLIATLATIIASQALITGAFSLTQQAVQLGYFPRIRVFHTSRETEGQIFVPKVNLLLMIACVTLVLVFGESSQLAAAYGIAVTATMTITTLLFGAVTRMLWNWSWPKTVLWVIAFAIVDLGFFGANVIKLLDGGWVPVMIASTIFLVMTTWKRGRQSMSDLFQKQAVSLEDFVDRVASQKVHRVAGTAVFMTLLRNLAPTALLHHIRHNRSIHERVILLSVVTRNEPEVPATHRVRITPFAHGFTKVVAAYGFMEAPDIREILAACAEAGLVLDVSTLSFYLGHENILCGGSTRMATWRKKLFIFLSRNSRPATEYFKLPPDRVIEIGAQIRV